LVHAHNQYRDGTYSSTYPSSGYPANLKNLGTSGAATSGSADLVDSVLAGGTKSGYTFVYTGDGNTPSTGYSIVATPVSQGTSGQRGFFTDQSGVIATTRRVRQPLRAPRWRWPWTAARSNGRPGFAAVAVAHRYPRHCHQRHDSRQEPSIHS